MFSPVGEDSHMLCIDGSVICIYSLLTLEVICEANLGKNVKIYFNP